MSSNDAVHRAALAELGWDDGHRLLVADEDNRKLEDFVSDADKKLAELTAELTDNTDKVNALSDHLKNVRQELQNSQALYAARKKEVESENHMKTILELDGARVKREIIRLDKELEALKERKNLYQNNVFRQTQHIDELKAEMQWDQKALESWLEECSRKDNDSMMIQKYSRQDEAKIQELTLKMTQLTEELQKKRRMLDNEVTETNLAQIVLDKTAEQFRQAHAERQELISQWETTIQQMQCRDSEMDLLAAELATIKQDVRRKEEQYKEKEQFFESVQLNNDGLEEKIRVAERLASRAREEYQESERQLSQFQSELDVLRRTVDRTANDLETSRIDVSQLKKDITEKTDKLQRIKKVNEGLEEKRKKMIQSKLSADERNTLIEKMLQDEEKTQAALSMEVSQLREFGFKKMQIGHELNTKLKIIDNEIQGTRATLRNFSLKLKKMDEQSLKQQEVLYNQDYNIQMLERRISHMSGEVVDDMQIVLQQKVKELQADLDSKIAAHNLLNSQLKSLQDDVRLVRRDLEKSALQKQDLTTKLEEIKLHNENASHAFKKSTNAKQDKMVEENMLKLEIKRLRDTLYQKADSVLSQEKHKLKLETAMKERQQEIQIHVDMLRAQLKAAESEKLQISTELHERIAKIDKLKKRFEILTFSMTPPEGEKEQTQAYLIIKAAQEKEDLQREGDELDAKVRKAEKELRALKNTLRLLSTRNEMYRKSFVKVPEGGDEAEDLGEHEEQLRAVTDKHKYKRRQIRELQEDLQAMTKTLDSLNRNEAMSQECIDTKENATRQLQRELEEQRVKIERVTKLNTKYSREVRSAKKVKNETADERDFEVRELRELTKEALKHFSEVAYNIPEMAPDVQTYCAQADLHIPVVPGSVAGARSTSSSTLSSARSSAKSSSSVVSQPRSAGYKVPLQQAQVGGDWFTVAQAEGRSSAFGESPVTGKKDGASSVRSTTSSASSASGASKIVKGISSRNSIGAKK